MICFQDLKPSSENEVVMLPCCSIYAHKPHIITWLKENTKCPNCKTNLKYWLEEIEK
ncbi:MAG: RING finger domain-containing protein [Candidatus Heimdallarchaeaceae archaeon]